MILCRFDLAIGFAAEQHEDNTWDLQVQISHLGVAYLLTSRQEFLKRFRERFLRYLKHNSARGWGGSHGFMHHITVSYFLTEHHPVWSIEDRRTALQLIREVFLSGDGIRWGGFVAGTKSPYPRDNHATRAALDNFIHARYLDRYHKLPEAKEGLKLVDRFFRWQFQCVKPAEGRYDGEDCNYGLVDIKDEPWDVLTRRVRDVNQQIKQLHATSRGR